MMASKGVKHVVWVPFSIDRETYTPPPGWVEWRIELFEQFTLRSMLNQTFDDFDIWLGCGERHKKITDAHHWHPRVRIVHGNDWPLNELDADFLAISRIDSDDMYHKDALGHLAAEAENRCGLNLRAFVLNKNIWWNRLEGLIGPHVRQRTTPPFVTRVYPKRFYHDADFFYKTFYVAHGAATIRAICKATGEARGVEPLEIANMCCIVKHGSNTSLVKKGLEPKPLGPEDIETLRASGRIFDMGRQEVEWELAKYSVRPEDVFLTPERQYLGGEMVSA